MLHSINQMFCLFSFFWGRVFAGSPTLPPTLPSPPLLNFGRLRFIAPSHRSSEATINIKIDIKYLTTTAQRARLLELRQPRRQPK